MPSTNVAQAIGSRSGCDPTGATADGRGPQPGLAALHPAGRVGSQTTADDAHRCGERMTCAGAAFVPGSCHQRTLRRPPAVDRDATLPGLAALHPAGRVGSQTTADDAHRRGERMTHAGAAFVPGSCHQRTVRRPPAVDRDATLPGLAALHPAGRVGSQTTADDVDRCGERMVRAGVAFVPESCHQRTVRRPSAVDRDATLPCLAALHPLVGSVPKRLPMTWIGAANA